MCDPMTTPTDYPDRVRALLEAATPGPWGFDTAVVDRLVNGEHHTSDGPPLVFAGEYGDDTIATDVRTMDDAALIAEAPTLARAYLDLHAEVERLTRVLRVEHLVERLADGMADLVSRKRPAKAASVMAIQHFLDAELGRTDYPLTVIPDGENGWAFWILEDDATGYVHEDLSVEWYGTQWPDDEVTP